MPVVSVTEWFEILGQGQPIRKTELIACHSVAIAAGGFTTDVVLADKGLLTQGRHMMAEVVEPAAKVGSTIPRLFIDLQFERTLKSVCYSRSRLIDCQKKISAY